MSYYVDWMKPLKRIIIVTSALMVVATYQYVFGGIGLAVLLVFILWVLVATILFMHSSSSIKIDNEIISHLIFGIVKKEYPIGNFSEFIVEVGVYPGIIKFKNGESFRVSGIAIGRNSALARALLDIHNENQLTHK